MLMHRTYHPANGHRHPERREGSPSLRTCALYLLFLLTPADAFAIQPSQRPFRYGVIRLDPSLDVVKPLAMADYAGWQVNNKTLIGAINDEWVMALHLENKKHLWWLHTPTALSMPVGSFEGWVVLGLRDGSILKVSAETGKIAWQLKLDTYSPREVTLAGKNLLVLTSGQQLYSIDFQSGVTGWLFDAGFPDNLTLQSGPAAVVNNHAVYIGIASGEVLALDANTGQQIWRFDPEYSDSRFHDVMGQLAVFNNSLLLSRYDGLVAAYDITGASPRKVWQEKLASITTSAFRDGKYYVGCINGDVIAFDGANGKRLWRTNTGTPVSTITPGETSLFVAGSNGRINAIGTGGEVQWYDDIGGEIVHKPFVYAGGIFFGTGLKNIYGYKAQ